MSVRDSVPEDVRERFVLLLAYIYGSIRWNKIRTSKNPWDIWNHRLRHCATRPTLGEFVSRLCNQFGLQSIGPAPAQILQELIPFEEKLLDLAYREHVPLAVSAIMESRKLKIARKQETEGEGNE
jgi:hypothetical protein